MRYIYITLCLVLLFATGIHAQQVGGAGVNNGWEFTTGANGGSFELQEDTINNLEPTPAEVRYGTRLYPTAVGGSSESAAMYYRHNPTGVGNQQNGLYFEITDEQQDTEAGIIKVISEGAGDAIYVASFNNGPAFEAASFYNGTRGIISTLQTIDGGSKDFGNSTLLNLIWGWDGTGGSQTTPNYAGIYYQLSLGNAFRIRLQDSGATGFAWGRTEIAVTEYSLARNRFEVYNTGLTRLLSTVATAGSTIENPPEFSFVGSYYTGGSASNKVVKYSPALDGAGNPYFVIKMGAESSETTELTLTSAYMDLADNNVINVGSMDVDSINADATTVDYMDVNLLELEQADLGATCTLNQMKIDTGGATVELCYCTATDTWNCVALDAGPAD